MNSTQKKDFYSSAVNQQTNNCNRRFKVIYPQLHTGKDRPLPLYKSASELAEEFSDHFVSKIENILRDHK